MQGAARMIPKQRIPGSKPAWAVVSAYVAVFGALLLATHGLPYAIDNNESFSSLWHARSLYERGIGETKGLADEVFAWHPEASPYVHTHQGNFPRLYAFALYVLGARTIESQIWLTTFTVGLAAILFAFRFLRTVGNPLFAVLGCLLLITDYAMLGQWQVNTYRVWYGFFFFSSLLWVHAAGSMPARRAIAFGVVNFAAMAYSEYAYTAFVGLMCTLYALACHWRSRRTLLACWAGIAVGGGLAAGILLLQLTAYMGWENVLRDIGYTLTARDTARDQAYAEEVIRFYEGLRVIFWQNYLDTSALKSFHALVVAVFSHHLRYYGADLVLGALTLASAWLAGLVPLPSIRSRSGRSAPAATKVLIIGACLAGLAYAVLNRGGSVPVASALGAAILAIPEASALGAAIRAIPEASALWAAILAIPVAFTLGFAFGFTWKSSPESWVQLDRYRLVAALAWTAAILWLFYAAPGLLPANFSESWAIVTGHRTSGTPIGTLALLLAAILGLGTVALGTGPILGNDSSTRLVALAAPLACAAIAFLPIYFVFTGYVYSGYFNRQAPFLVFAVDIFLAAALYLPVRHAMHALPWAARLPHPAIGQTFLARILKTWPRAGTAAGAASLAIVGFGSWSILQYEYLSKVTPPNRYDFLQVLDKPPFRGTSFVANNYPAPMAEKTRSWAYAESALFSGNLTLRADGFQGEHDDKYLWFADADMNAAYQTPEFGIMISQPASLGEALDMRVRQLTARADPAIAFATTGVVRRALEPPQAFLQHEVVATKGDHYTIVRFDWDFPPFLRPVDPGLRSSAALLSLREKLAMSRAGQALRGRWRVELAPMTPSGGEDAPAIGLRGATAGSEALFGETLMADAGWQRDSLGTWWAMPGARPLGAFTSEPRVMLSLATAADGGVVRFTANDFDQWIDLSSDPGNDRTIRLYAATRHGTRTFVPRFSAGTHVMTRVDDDRALVTYLYAHQAGNLEEGTQFRIYTETEFGQWELHETLVLIGSSGRAIELQRFRDLNPDTVEEHSRVVSLGDRRSYTHWLIDHLESNPEEAARPGVLTLPAIDGEIVGSVSRVLPLPATDRRIQLSVAPGTRSKVGPEYFGLSFRHEGADAPVGLVAFGSSTIPADLPLEYGRLRMRIVFPKGRTEQSEPLLTTGSEEAGDFIYVVYSSPESIRIGFDHWFFGGPLSQPIAIDFDAEHELEISTGALFPPAEEIVFADMPVDAVASMKEMVSVRLDGELILEFPATAYESDPDLVTPGLNTISGTTSGPRFTGEILSVERIWPDI
jgi:hypothetical protein